MRPHLAVADLVRRVQHRVRIHTCLVHRCLHYPHTDLVVGHERFTCSYPVPTHQVFYELCGTYKVLTLIRHFVLGTQQVTDHSLS